MEPQEKDKKSYELALLLKSEGDFTRVTEVLRQHNGELVSEPRMRNVALAYKIKGNTDAVFTSCFFQATAEDAKALEEDLTTRDVAIRFMILKATAPAEGQPTSMPVFSEEGKRKFGTYPAPHREPKPAAPAPLSNEALENLLKKI